MGRTASVLPVPVPAMMPNPSPERASSRTRSPCDFDRNVSMSSVNEISMVSHAARVGAMMIMRPVWRIERAKSGGIGRQGAVVNGGKHDGSFNQRGKWAIHIGRRQASPLHLLIKNANFSRLLTFSAPESRRSALPRFRANDKCANQAFPRNRRTRREANRERATKYRALWRARCNRAPPPRCA